MLLRQMAEVISRGPRGNGITICEAGDEPMPDVAGDAEVDVKLAADIDYARQLQAKLDAEEARGGNRSASGAVSLSWINPLLSTQTGNMDSPAVSGPC